MEKRAVGYMLTVGAVVTQPEGERSIMNHYPSPFANRKRVVSLRTGGGEGA